MNQVTIKINHWVRGTSWSCGGWATTVATFYKMNVQAQDPGTHLGNSSFLIFCLYFINREHPLHRLSMSSYYISVAAPFFTFKNNSPCFVRAPCTSCVWGRGLTVKGSRECLTDVSDASVMGLVTWFLERLSCPGPMAFVIPAVSSPVCRQLGNRTYSGKT